MNRNIEEKRKLLYKPYIRLMIVNIMVLMASLVCGFVDNILISRFLGAEALSAVGYFSPIASLSGFAVCIVTGTVIICGGFIGSGKQDKVTTMFVSSFITIMVLTFAFSFSLFVFRGPLASLLGARENAAVLLQDYLRGYAFSIFFSFNNDIKRSYLATAVMFFSNIVFDALLVRYMGIFGIGIASTISCLASFLILIPAYTNVSKTVHFEKAPFDIHLVLSALNRGLPNLLITMAFLVKNGLTNFAVIKAAGAEGIAVANVMVSVAGIAGALSGGCTNAFQSLASVVYGENDREAYIADYRISLIIGEISTFILVLLMALFSNACSSVFFTPNTNTFDMCKDVFLLGFWYYLLNIPINLFVSSYRVQGKMKLVNIVAFLETAISGVLAVLLVPVFGIKAAWLSGLLGDVIALTLILITVIVEKRGIDFSPAALLKLPDHFGSNDDEYVELTVSSKEDVSFVSEAVMQFCKKKIDDSKKSFWAGLCVEEITSNILQHGSYRNGYNTINIRVYPKMISR